MVHRRGAPLVWLGCADPVETIVAARDADPVRAARRAVFTAWRDALGTISQYLVSDLVKRAEGDELRKVVPDLPLRTVLLDVARHRGEPDKIDQLRLAKWLSKNENTVATRLKLVVDRSDAKRPRWQLVAVC
jgi:hypothetical protein